MCICNCSSFPFSRLTTDTHHRALPQSHNHLWMHKQTKMLSQNRRQSMSASHSSISRLNNVALLLLSHLTNSTRKKLRINILRHDRVCVCVCLTHSIEKPAGKRSLMIKCPLKQTFRTSVFMFVCVSEWAFNHFHVFDMWETVNLSRLIFYRKNWLQHLVYKTGILFCFRRLNGFVWSIDWRKATRTLTSKGRLKFRRLLNFSLQSGSLVLH